MAEEPFRPVFADALEDRDRLVRATDEPREDWAWADGPVTSDDLEDLSCWFPQMTVLQPERTL